MLRHTYIIKHIAFVLKTCTGIPEWCIFQAILNLVEPALLDGVKLSKFSMVLMFFLKFRFNLFDEGGSHIHCLDVHASTPEFLRKSTARTKLDKMAAHDSNMTADLA